MIVNKKFISIALLHCLFLMPNVLSAQQVAQYTLNSLNKYIVNPAIAGTEEFIDFKASYRTQWVGLESAPKTGYFSAHMPIGQHLGQSSHNHRKDENKSWMGVGTQISKDVTGPSSRVIAYATASYNVPLSNKYRASFGLSMGLQNYMFDGSQVALTERNDVLFTTAQSKMSPDGQAGAWLYSDDFYLGVATHQLFKNKLDFYDGTDVDTTTGSYLNRHLMISSGFNVVVSDQINMSPSVLIKVAYPAPMSIDLGVRFKYEDKYWAGVYTRWEDSFSVVVGALVQDLVSISYGYDLNYSSLHPFNSGSHEILLGFKWPPKNRLDCPSKFWH